MSSTRPPPAFERTTALVARALGLTPSDLEQGLRPAKVGDLADIVAFRKANFDELIRGDDAAYLRWRYRLRRADAGMGELWLLYRRGELIGVVGTEDIECWYDGAIRRGVRTMDILVARAVQSSGLGVWLNQAIFRTSPFAMAVGANRQSAGTVNRLFRAMPPLVEWRLLIDTRAFVRKRIPLALLAAPVALVTSLALRLWRALAGGLSDRKLVMQPIARFDDEASALYASGESGRIGLKRDAAFLNYRLFENPRGAYLAAGAFRNGRLEGIIAWRAISQDGEPPWVHIIEVQASGNERNSVLRKLLLHVGRQADAAGCNRASLVMLDALPNSVLWSCGFIAARHNRKVFGLHAEDPALLSSLSSAKWALTDLSDDNDGS